MMMRPFLERPEYEDLSPEAKIRYLQAQRDYCLAAAAALDEVIAKLRPGEQAHPVDLSAFNPAWKKGDRLTRLGKTAVYAAFDRGMKQIEVARLFQISTPSAHRIHTIWENDRRP
ncbi:hypothetical protein J2R99_001731 [Rhodopseudomonas julia]|uniref:Uncharacterized protein n=1 Tax=Rhodopseudomonas julia TaxID=200617 RepID=A0ABU0C9Y0_9BRAD|nr:hypothetical protein [Rhodopseudomonas julia]MDQ0325882.1 hypothetical protein [Rhodopseudomonas julia]